MRVVTITSGSSTGVAPPASPVPLPRATNGRPWRAATPHRGRDLARSTREAHRDRAARVRRPRRGRRARARAARRAPGRGRVPTCEIGEERRQSVDDPPMTTTTALRSTSRCRRASSEDARRTRPRGVGHVPGPEARNARWQIDVTFLLSSWQCIFGHGCQGVLTEPAPELVQGCCSYGAHASDKKDQRARRARSRSSSATTSGSSASAARRRASG